MDTWQEIRLAARQHHARALFKSNGDRRAAALCAAALKLDDLQLAYYRPGTRAGDGVHGFLDRPSLIVHVAEGQTPPEETVVVAHEIGHLKLHRDPSQDVTMLSPGLGGDQIEAGSAKAQGYSPRERKEVQADVFAGEFLCPADWLRDQILVQGRKPSVIATDLGLPENLVVNQAVRALLLPPLRAPTPAAAAPVVALDPSQLEAASWNGGPLLVDAGPGTGKTRTLVHRIGLLLEKSLPASILALTFSVKAAEEMRERLSVMNAQAAIEMWIGNFHGFGWELLGKHHELINRTINVRLLDETASLGLLEDNLERLPLQHFLNIYEPAFDLTYVLRAISRCKDEMITPEEYLAEAEVAARSTDPAVREAADKALELAAIYKVYQELLQENDVVDFGDLVMLSARLLEDHPEIAEIYRARFKHILVDEYQDVNLASARLLRALCKPDTDVWVVADPRQSIYRFRGAEPANVQRFESDFAGKRRSLQHNYRSGEPVVRLFSGFANAMEGVRVGGTWRANRGDIGSISMVVAPDANAEAAAIRENIEALRAEGVAYSDQVILARSHLTLARICAPLERLGVPLLYLGDLFERGEIRDLLSLIALDAEFGSIGIVRVAQFAEYGATKQDALAVLRWMNAQQTDIFSALARVAEVPDLSEQGRAGLIKLASHLQGVDRHTSPWTMLTTYLLERSSYLSGMIVSDDAKDKQKLIAIYQLLKVCSEHVASGDPSRKRLIERVRRVEALNDDRIFRAVASEATHIDAVRVMTVHGSKGLEFRGVHLPGLATRYMPSSRQGTRCPPPAGLAHLAIRAVDHDAEEECLFFVAISRARDHLRLSRAERYKTQTASASKFLTKIPLPSQRRVPPAAYAEPLIPLHPPAVRATYTEAELSLYLRCPARYRYEIIDGLKGAGGSSPFVRFHGCVYRTVGWLEEQRATGKAVDRAGAFARLESEWTARGPTGGLEKFYRKSATAMVSSMVDTIAAESGAYGHDEWLIPMGDKSVAITPDRVVVGADGTMHVQRIRTGRRSTSEPDDKVYALLRHGAAARYPGRRLSIEAFYPAAGEAIRISLGRKEHDKLSEYAKAIDGIERGLFPVETADRKCPRCPCYFICNA